MAMSQSQIEQAISSFEDLGEVLSKLISPIHGVSPLYLTTKDLEVISSSRSNLHRYLLDAQSQLTTEKAIAETPIDSENKEPGFVQLKAEEIEDLRSENERNLKEIEALQNALRELHSCGRETPGDCQTTVELMQTKQELNRCKETLQAMKVDRRRLKSDKVDLVSQMKQLYHTLEDKESELREFIRNYEQRMNEISADAKKMEIEKYEIERTKNAAMDECRLLKEKLEIVYRQPKGVSNVEKKALNNAFVRYSYSDDSVLKRVSTDGGQCSSSGDDLPPYQDVYVLDMFNHSPVLAPRAAGVSEGRRPPPVDPLDALQIPSQLLCTQPGEKQDDDNTQRKELNLLRRNPAATKNNTTESPQRLSKALRPTLRSSTIESQNGIRVSFLSQENYEEKLKTVGEAKELPVNQWRANHVLSWLELEMNMTNYGSACADNIKSGKVLLGLSDAELDSALRLQSPLHRRKLRLAIEELRDSSAVQFPAASKMSHVWVSQDWIVSLGLAQYSRTFEEQLIDGRLLNVLTKKDLYKYLKIHKKFHQMSIAYAVELLRSLDFDKDRLQGRRVQSREHFSDPLVWSNEQVIEWANHIDLGEYSHALKETGVHGAVLVLDQGFTCDLFASMLGIPSSKSYVRRHLSAELEAIIRPARVAVEESRSSARSTTTKPAFGRSFSGGNKSDADTSSNRGSTSGSGSGRKPSFRGSLGRAFGRKPAKDLSLERHKEESGKGSSKSDLSQTFSSTPVSIP